MCWSPRQKYPLPAEFDGSHNRARRAGQSAMANTAPACGACRRCRERGGARQLHGSRNTRTLTPVQLVRILHCHGRPLLPCPFCLFSSSPCCAFPYLAAHSSWPHCSFHRYNGLANSRFHTLLFGINMLRSDKLPHCRAKRRCLGAIVQLLCNQNFNGLSCRCSEITSAGRPTLRLTAMGLTSLELTGVGTSRRKSAICD